MSWFDRAAARALPLVPQPVMRRLGRRYVAGASRAAALEIGGHLARAGYRLTYDVLGEAVAGRAMVEQALVEYHGLLADLRRLGFERNVSVKPTQMGLLFDAALCRDSVSGLVAELAGGGDFVRFEMEDSTTTERTLQVYAELRRRHRSLVGCVLQAMLRRSAADAERLLSDPAPLNVRLVKGVYLEPPDRAYQQRQEINDSYLRLLRLLLGGGAFVGVATHDEKLIEALQRLLAANPPWRKHCEVQMLLGVREQLRRAVKEAGLPVRVYVPYGSHWLPYVRRRLRENPKLIRYGLLGVFGGRERLLQSD